MNSHANAVKIGQAVTLGLVSELEEIARRPYQMVEHRSVEAARGAAFRIINNLWYDLFHVSVRARYDYTLEAYLKAIGWPE